jgi:predicted small integral membrane protein
VGNLEGKRPQGRLRSRRMGSTKIDIGEMAWVGMDWVDLVQDRDKWRALVNSVILGILGIS